METTHVQIISLKSKNQYKFEKSLKLLQPGMLIKFWAPGHVLYPHAYPHHTSAFHNGQVIPCSFIAMEHLDFHSGCEFQKPFGTLQGSLEKFLLLYCWHDAEVKGFLFRRCMAMHKKEIELIVIAPFEHLAYMRNVGLIKGWS